MRSEFSPAFCDVRPTNQQTLLKYLQLQGNTSLFPQIQHWHEYPGRTHIIYLHTVKILRNSIFWIIYIYVARWRSADVSEKDVASIFRVEQRLLPASFWFLTWLILQLWRWGRNVSPKRPLTFNRLDGVISHKTRTLLNYRCEKLNRYKNAL
jgi:hypothetical protein